MHRNYFLFEKQINSLNTLLKPSTISGCFTHRKDELVVIVNSNEEYYLRIGISSQTPYMLIEKSYPIKDPSTHFFNELNGKNIENFNILPYDKIVDIPVEHFSLKCVFFGRERNVFLMDSTTKIIQSFKKTEKSTFQISSNSTDQILSPFDLDKIEMPDRETIFWRI